MGSVTTEEHNAQIEGTTIWFRIHGLLERMQALLTRRYQDPRNQDPDYCRRLRELENQLSEIDREQFRMGDYNEGGGSKWDKWIMPGLVTLAVSGIIANVVQAMTVSALKQEVADLRQEVNDVKRLVEPRFRGG